MGFWNVKESVENIRRQNEREPRQAAAKAEDARKRQVAAAVRSKRSI